MAWSTKQYWEDLKQQETDLKFPLHYLILLAVVMHLIMPVLSIGSYHLDEHFQILEFASLKLGNNTLKEMPWEYAEMIRPTLQPAVTYLFFKALSGIGVTNPFVWNYLLKALTGIASILLVISINLRASQWKLDTHSIKLLWGLSFLLWFMPYLHIRFTSENIGAIIFTVATLIILGYEKGNKDKWQFVLVGLLLGISFFLRFQLAFAIAGLGLWLLIVQRTEWINVLYMTIAFLLTCGANLLIDSWFYGTVTFSPYNYFYSNIVDDKASMFGVQSWYHYPVEFLLRAGPPLSLIIIVITILGLWQKRTHLWTWCIIFFVIPHFIVGHKELRFLYPMLYFLPFFLVAGLVQVKVWSEKFFKVLLWTSASFNVLFLILIFLPITHRHLDFFEYYQSELYRWKRNESALMLYTNTDPYSIYGLSVNGYLKMSFFNAPNLELKHLRDQKDLVTFLGKYDFSRPVAITTQGYDIPNLGPQFQLEEIAGTFPKEHEQKNYFNWQERVFIRYSYLITKSDQ